MTVKEAIKGLKVLAKDFSGYKPNEKMFEMAIEALEKQIPKKPIETRDTAWGIPSKQAVCPKCDKYLGHVAFLGDYKGKRITYCETCGQAVDWEGWDFDE